MKRVWSYIQAILRNNEIIFSNVILKLKSLTTGGSFMSEDDLGCFSPYFLALCNVIRLVWLTAFKNPSLGLIMIKLSGKVFKYIFFLHFFI